MSKDWMRKTDDELAKIAQAGVQGQGAVIEAMRRLREALKEAAQSSDRYSERMFWLTVVIAVLTAVQLIPAIDVIKHWLRP